MSSNLLKNGYGNLQPGTRKVIDSNTLVAERIEALAARMRQPENEGFTEGIAADEAVVASLTVDGEAFEGLQGSVIKAVDPQIIQEEAKKEAERIIEEARLQARTLEEEAKDRIQQEKDRVCEEAKSKGYEEGMNRAMAEVEGMKSRLLQQKTQLEAEHAQILSSLEEELIEQLTDIYEYIFRVDFSEDKNVLLHLIASAMKKAENSRSFLVRVSMEDYPYVASKRQELLNRLPYENCSLDIVEDTSFAQNQCTIEMESGIFDCGLDTQLTELTKRLRQLSYQK